MTGLKLNRHPNYRTPIWEIKKKMKQLTLELELLQKDPSTNHDEIANTEWKLGRFKREYSERKFEIAQSIHKKEVTN